EPLEAGAAPGQRVDVRRPQVDVAVQTQVAPALIVGEDDDDVWLLHRPGGRRTGTEQHDGGEEVTHRLPSLAHFQTSAGREKAYGCEGAVDREPDLTAGGWYTHRRCVSPWRAADE